MAIPRKLPLDFSMVFPHGAYMVGDIEPLRDFDKSTRDNVVQATDPDTGTLLWAVEVVDGDPEASKANRTLTIKVQAPVKPVLTRSQDTPFTPVEFKGLVGTPWVEQVGENFSRINWSLRASTVTNVEGRPSGRSEKAA